jgi:hypothetical protein
MQRRGRPLTLDRFEEWLRKHSPDDVVGYAGLENSCPIAFYLKSTHGSVADVCVWVDHYSVNGREYNSPKWAKYFVVDLDAPRDDGVPVKAGEAIAILDDVKRQLKRGDLYE